MTDTPAGGARRHVLITGASSGIGAALATRMAVPGTRLTLIGRSETRLGEVAAQCRSKQADALPVICDVRDWDRLAATLLAADDALPVDTLVANAGVGGQRSMAGPEGEDPAMAREIAEVNFLGVIAAVSTLAPAMVRRGRGRICVVSSLGGVAPLPLAPGYGAGKAGIAAYARNLRVLLRPKGVSVTLALPGFVDTPMSRDLPGPKPGLMTADEAASRIAAAIEAGRGEIAFPLSLRLAALAARLAPEPLLALVLKSWERK